MAGYIGSGEPPTEQTTAYQHTCAVKGWNDPPKQVFAQPNANRTKIDLRKRVAHDLSSTSSVRQPQQNGYTNGHAATANAFPPQIPGPSPTPQVPNMLQPQPAQGPGLLQPQPPQVPNMMIPQIP